MERPRTTFRRTVGSPPLFALVYSTVAGAMYFALGVVAGRALGLTPLVFLAAGLFFALAVMTYVEGASLHQERGGAHVFARYAFNELWSFVAGWAILLDYLILIAVAALASTEYMSVFWGELAHDEVELIVSLGVVAWIAIVNIRGITARVLRWLAVVAVADLLVQLSVIGLGLALVFDADALVDPIDLGTAPTWGNVVFAFTLAVIAFTGLEASSGLAGELPISRRGLKRLVSVRIAATLVTYVGMALVAVTALPVVAGETALGGRFEDAPVLGIVGAYDPSWLADGLRYIVGTVAVVVLVSTANAAMLGLSRLAYSLATNRQIPSALGRLHPTHSTPFVLIAIATVLSMVLLLPVDLEFLIGLYAFGALLAFTIAHAAVCVLRYREPDRDRPYRMPLSIRIGGGDLPLPAAVGAIVTALAWVSVVIQHGGARVVGGLWMAFGLGLYLIYRTSEGKPIYKRVTIPERALREEPTDVEYGSILVPVFGRELDDDIMQTAGRLAGEEREDEGEGGAVIEALWVFEVPMSLPIDARVPESELKRARNALARAKAVGEEYEGVEVATATVRARRAGQAIVEEAKRRGVEAIVLAAEEPSRIRGGSLLGGRGGPLENFVGDVTKYVVEKASCRVLLTAPPAPDGAGDRSRHPVLGPKLPAPEAPEAPPPAR